MASKARVLRTFHYEDTDRVTIGFDTNPEIYKKLCIELGISDFDGEKLCKALGVDYRGVGTPYVGKALFPPRPNRMVNPLEGCVMRWVEHESGEYWAWKMSYAI